jgi:aminomethyltransferase
MVPFAGYEMPVQYPLGVKKEHLQTREAAGLFDVSHSYTGEDGFEISIPAGDAERIARLLLAQPEVEFISLGARDSLRLEAGLCLYGHDIDTSTTPVEASLLWAISHNRRAEGERAGGFPGAPIILDQIQTKNVERKRVGLIGQGKAPIREGAELVNVRGETIGVVTSGSFGPTAGVPVAMGYVATDYAAIDTEVYALVRGKPLPMNVAKTLFVPQRYHRG